MSGVSSTSQSAFLSHASKDAALAQQLCALLEAKGVRCWIAPRDVQPGCSYPDEIVRGIEECSSLLLLATSNAIASHNVLNEVEQAHKRRKTILTVMVGKPGISRDLDYYISRLHWIEFGGTSMEEVVDRLADVLRGRREWNDVASPPSLVRRLSYARHAFLGSLSASLLVLVLVALAGYSYFNRVQRTIATDYRSLGWVTFESTALPQDGLTARNGTDVQMQIWLGDARTEFRRIQVLAATEQASGSREPVNLSSTLNGGATGEAMLRFHLPPATNRVTTCLTIPSATLRTRYQVKQVFAVGGEDDDLRIVAQGEPTVRKFDEVAREDACP